MKRRPLAHLCFLAVVLPSVTPAQTLGSGAVIQIPHPWAQRNHDPRRTAQSDYRGPTTGEVVWKTLQPGTVPQFAVSNRGNISLNDVWNPAWWSEEDYLTVLNARGEVMLHKKVQSFPWGFSQSVQSSGGFDNANNLVLPTSNGDVVKTSLVGDTQWLVHGSSNSTNDSSIAIMPNGDVYGFQFLVGLFKIRADGTVVFSGAAGGATPAIAPNGDIATGAVRSNEPHTFPAVYYDNPNGANRWIFKTTNGGGSIPVFGPDGTLYIGVDNLGLYAFNPDGSIKWTNATATWRSSLAFGKNGVLYVGNSNGVAAVNPSNGAVVWSTQIPDSLRSGIALDSRGLIFTTSSTGRIYGLNPDGTFALNAQVCDNFLTGPVIATQGRAIACGKVGFDTFVFAIQ